MILASIRSPAGRYAAALALTLLGLLASDPGHTAPPSNPDPVLAPWFRSLTQPGTGASCCDLSDCRAVRSRIGAEGYEAYLTSPTFPVMEDQWVPIPADKILQQKDNPLGRAVVCWTPHRGVICFVRPVEG